MNIPLNIHWQQIILHLLNFAILAGGLYFLLYRPVRKFMDQREEHYRQMETEAQQRLDQAKKTEEAYHQQLKQADEEIRQEKAQAQQTMKRGCPAAHGRGRQTGPGHSGHGQRGRRALSRQGGAGHPERAAGVGSDGGGEAGAPV
ncbi:MAG: ATP synthase F0 subunit B [Lawsonibacter sp.]